MSELFSLGEGYDLGLDLYDSINSRMVGRIGMERESFAVLCEAVYKVGDRDYLEIGTYFGGTYIGAGLVKRYFELGGNLTAVDPFDEGYPYRKDEETGEVSSVKVFSENLRRFEMTMNLYQESSSDIDWAQMFKMHEFGVCLVDGDHNEGHAAQDIWNVAQTGCPYILIDDVSSRYPHLYKIAKAVMRSTVYNIVHLSGKMLVLKNGHK